MHCTVISTHPDIHSCLSLECELCSCSLVEVFGGRMVEFYFLCFSPCIGSRLVFASHSGKCLQNCLLQRHSLSGSIVQLEWVWKVVTESVTMNLKTVTESVTSIIPCSLKNGVLGRYSFAWSCWGIIYGRKLVKVLPRYCLFFFVFFPPFVGLLGRARGLESPT